MSLLFTHFDDRTHLCTHGGTLGRKLENGARMCLRCGVLVYPDESETFTKPVGRVGRSADPTRKVR